MFEVLVPGARVPSAQFVTTKHILKTMGVFGAPAPADAQLGIIAAADIGHYAATRLAALNFKRFEVVNLTCLRGQYSPVGTFIVSSTATRLGTR